MDGLLQQIMDLLTAQSDAVEESETSDSSLAQGQTSEEVVLTNALQGGLAEDVQDTRTFPKQFNETVSQADETDSVISDAARHGTGVFCRNDAMQCQSPVHRELRGRRKVCGIRQTAAQTSYREDSVTSSHIQEGTMLNFVKNMVTGSQSGRADFRTGEYAADDRYRQSGGRETSILYAGWSDDIGDAAESGNVLAKCLSVLPAVRV